MCFYPIFIHNSKRIDGKCKISLANSKIICQIFFLFANNLSKRLAFNVKMVSSTLRACFSNEHLCLDAKLRRCADLHLYRI